MSDANAHDNKVSFKDTLNLPTTDFPIRPNAAIDDPSMIERWEKQNLFHVSSIYHEGHTKFILHDGPPYANGPIHIGHAYNKILKDIVCKSQRMRGYQVPVTPGWDCHGLPIEFKVAQENPGLSRKELKKACRAYAQSWIEVQKKEFKRLGVLMDWDNPYTTMSYSYEAATLKAFAEFVDKKYIERKNKTVPWCAHCQTVLAIAEIEYAERKDPSIYVQFPLEMSVVEKIAPSLSGKEVSLLVWTTTPWTLPLNRAVLLKPGALYVLLDINDTYVIVGKDLADKVCAMLAVDKKIVTEFIAEELIKHAAKVQHPFISALQVPIILDQSVLLEEGTACVHCAPGVGPQDYEVGVKNNLGIFSPISPDGKYTQEIGITELVGMPVSDGQIWVLKKLAEHNKMLYKTSIRHSYPHCWRCRQGLIFRATKQWFCDLSQASLKQKSVKAIDGILMLPEKSNNRLKAAIEGRLEWCLSRQRVWGVPIPAFICEACDYTYITKELVCKAADSVEKEGIEYWDDATVVEYGLDKKLCPSCGKNAWKKEEDILDVWFDSGVSHYAVLAENPMLAFPADMYLEGRDQHRGWFQSSLLTGIVLADQAPMKTIITHGYTVDELGRKMSKSLGNGVTPQEMIDKLGTDGLRLWASSIDCTGDVVISNKLIANVQEVFRKIRNTCRFLLANLYDFDIAKHAVSIEQMTTIDQRAMQELSQINTEMISAYNQYDFTAVFHGLSDYCITNLSSFYLDICKDRLYVGLPHGLPRRSAQTACYYILDTLTKLIAPILSFTAEQISDLYQKDKAVSIHLQEFANTSVVDNYFILQESSAENSKAWVEINALWNLIKQIRSALLKAIEEQRALDIIKHSLEARLMLYFDPASSDANTLQQFFTTLHKKNEIPELFLKEMLIVSDVEIVSEQRDLQPSILPGLFVQVKRAAGNKCPRCWQWEENNNEHHLCNRCYTIVHELKAK